MHVFDLRDRCPTGCASLASVQIAVLDDGALSRYGVTCRHEARAVVEVPLNRRHALLCCAECATLLGVIERPVD